MLKVGAVEVTITPLERGVPLIGPVAPSTGVHDDLFCRVLVIDGGESRAVVVTADLVGLDFGMVDRLRAAIERRAGIPPSRVMINTSHTHSSPFTIPWSAIGWEAFQQRQAAWREELVSKVADTVESAVARLRPATLCAGRGAVQVGFNRRLPTPDGVTMAPNPEGTTVPWTDVLYAVDGEGDPVALLLTHAAHPVVVHGASTRISADYPGYAVRAVRRLLGPRVVAMFAQACGADNNAHPLRGGFAAARRAGTILGAAATKAALEAEPIEAGGLVCLSERLSLPLLPAPPVDRIEQAIAELGGTTDAPENDHDGSPAPWYRRDTVLCCRDLLEIARREEPPTLRFEIQAFALGPDFCLLGLTHEVFAEYQLWIDQNSPFRHTMVLAYTNGCESYVPRDKDFVLGGYEAAASPAPSAALRYARRVALRPGIERLIQQQIQTLWSDTAGINKGATLCQP